MGLFGRRKKPAYEPPADLSEEQKKRIDEMMPDTTGAMRAVLEAQKKSRRGGWFRRRFLPGAAAAAIVAGAHGKYLHEPIKDVSQIVIYTADATERLGRAAVLLGEEIVGHGTQSSRFAKAQSEFEAADRQYFEGMRDLLNTYKENLGNRTYIVNEMKNLAEGFGRIVKKVPGYETSREIEITKLRDRINSLMSEFLGGQSREDVQNRLSEDYTKNYDELLKMLNEADRSKRVSNKEISEISEKLVRVSKGLEKLNKDDEKELTDKIGEVNRLYDLGQRIRELETGQIRTRDVAYQQLTELGRKYGLDADRPEKYATVIAYAAGILLAGLAYRFGSKIGDKVIPLRGINLEEISRSYSEGRVRQEKQATEKKGESGLEDKVTTALVLFSPIFLLPFIINITGFSIAGSFFQSVSYISNYLLIFWFFILAFVVFRKVYKKRRI